MFRAYCTYFDCNYLVKGLALIESLTIRETSPFRIFVVCLDELTLSILNKIDHPNVVPVSLKRIEQNDEALSLAKGNRSLVEYYWTLTPTVLLRLMEEVPHGDAITYIDGDLFFYSTPEPIFEEFNGHSVLIHGHRFSPALQNLETHGKYNVGLLCFRRDERGLEVLNWWRDRCNEWCYARVEDGKFGDQLYLNDWPERFEGVHVLEHIGAGVGPWNHQQYSYAQESDGRISVDGRPLVFYHFHAFTFVTEGLIVPAKILDYPMREEVVRWCVAPYLDSLYRAIAAIRMLEPDFNFGLNNNDVLEPDHTFVARKEFASAIRNAGILHPSFHLGNGWDCYVSKQMSYACLMQVSAVVSTYNSEIFMRGCLEDLTDQTLFAAGRMEIVVVDSASPQNEGAIVREFIEKYGDRIRYIRTDTRETIYQAWNRGIKAAQGKYVTNANTDDRHRSDALEQMVLTLDVNPDVALVYGDSLVTCYPNQTFEHHIRCGYHLRPEYQPEIMLSGCHMGPQPMWRHSVHDAVGYFSEQYRSAGDYEFWCRIAGKFKLLHIPQFLGLYYENPRGFANSDNSLSVQETISIQHAYADSFPPPTRDYAMNFQYNGVVAANKHVNICLITRNNLPDLEVVIESLVRNTDYPHVITVADMDSRDGTRDYLLGLKKRGLITNLLLLAGDISVADAFAQAERCEPEAGFQLAFGNSIVVGMPGWLSAFVREAQNCVAPFLIGRIWSRDRAVRNMAGILPAYAQDYSPEASCCMKLPARLTGV